MRAALAAFSPHGGDVVNTASLSGLGPVPGYAVYAATKAAVVSVTMSVSAEVPHGVRVHALCPDGVQTAMLDAQDKARLGSQLVHSGARILTVDETAEAAVALVGEQARREEPAVVARCPDPHERPRACPAASCRPVVRRPRPTGDREASRPAPPSDSGAGRALGRISRPAPRCCRAWASRRPALCVTLPDRCERDLAASVVGQGDGRGRVAAQRRTGARP